jgi:hypothetical protein
VSREEIDHDYQLRLKQQQTGKAGRDSLQSNPMGPRITADSGELNPKPLLLNSCSLIHPCLVGIIASCWMTELMATLPAAD